MKFFGQAATEGAGPISYTLRIPLWTADNALVEEFKDLTEGTILELTISGMKVLVEKRRFFEVLRVPGFPSIESARSKWRQLVIALVRFSIASRVALGFPMELSEIGREDDPNRQFRELLRDSVYPISWGVRADGSRTDGGIFPECAYILPEHERIWEHKDILVKTWRPCRILELDKFLSESKSFPVGAAENERIETASQAFWSALSQHDRRIQYVLYITALEILADDENVENWAEPVRPLFPDIQTLIRSKLTPGTKAVFQRFEDAIKHIGKPGSVAKTRNLIRRTLGTEKEASEIWGTRSKIVHGGGFSEMPTADECEALRKIVAAALDCKLMNASSASTS